MILSPNPEKNYLQFGLTDGIWSCEDLKENIGSGLQYLGASMPTTFVKRILLGLVSILCKH